MADVIFRKPKFELKFITERSEHTVTFDAIAPSSQSMTDKVVSITTKNDMSDDSSAYSVVLAGDTEWEKIVKPNDMMILKIYPNEKVPTHHAKKDKTLNDVLILGLISEVAREGEFSDGTKLCRITGQSLAKAFMQFELRMIRQVTMGLTTGWLDAGVGDDDENTLATTLMNGNVAETVGKLLERFLPYMTYAFESDETENTQLQSRIHVDLDSWTGDERLVDPVPLTSFEGSFNQLLRDIVNKPFCEMFFEVYSDSEGNEKAKFVVRRTPFDKADWLALPINELGSRDVIEESFIQSDLEAYALFNVVPESQLEANLAAGTARPQYSQSLVDKYGYKLLEVSHRYLSTLQPVVEDSEPETEEPAVGSGNVTVDAIEARNQGQVEGEDVVDEENPEVQKVKEYSQRLYNWYSLNPNFFAGEIKVIGHPDYRIGNRLIYKDAVNGSEWEFYIEGVSHSFSYTEGYTTTLKVTRGLKRNGDKIIYRFEPPAGPPQTFKGGLLGEPNLEQIEEIMNSQKVNNASSTGSTGSTGGPVAKKATDFAVTFAADGMKHKTAYHWGGGRQKENPLLQNPPYKLDCSSFVYWAYHYAGVRLKGGSTGMTTKTIRSDTGNLKKIGGIGSGLKTKDLRYGDIVFFGATDHHVGIYVGGGKFVAFNGTGKNNYEKGCEIQPMDHGYWSGQFKGHVHRYKEAGSPIAPGNGPQPIRP